MKKSTGVILTIVIILLLGVIGVGCYFYIKGNNDSTKEIGELKNEVAGLSKNMEKTTSEPTKNTENNSSTNTSTENSKNANTTKTYSNVKGTYQSQEINMNEGSNIEPSIATYDLVLSEDGTFALNTLLDTDCQNIGYYTIIENKLTLYSVVAKGNDPSACLTTQVDQFTINSDGTITGKDNIHYTKKSETVNRDTNIAKTIDYYLAGCGTSGKDGQGPWFSGLTK